MKAVFTTILNRLFAVTFIVNFFYIMKLSTCSEIAIEILY